MLQRKYVAHQFPKINHYLIRKYFYIRSSRTMYLFEANLNLLANTSTPDVVQYHLPKKLTASWLRCWSTRLSEREIPMQYHTSTEMYANKCTESQVCKDCTYRQNSVSKVLSDVRLSIYFRFKVLNTLQNNEQNIQNSVIYRVFPHKKTCLTFSLCNIIKIYLFVFQFKTILNFARLLTVAV